MPRIVTMIASATEIVCALGLEGDLAARSHECDWPPSVKRLPICTAPRFDVHGSSLEIDRRVKSLLEKAVSIYHVDAVMLKELQPDVIVTQSHCEVCAVSEKDVEYAMGDWLSVPPSPPWGRGEADSQDRVAVAEQSRGGLAEYPKRRRCSGGIISRGETCTPASSSGRTDCGQNGRHEREADRCVS